MQIKKPLIITLLFLAILTPALPALAGPGDPPVTTVKLQNPLENPLAKTADEKLKGQTDMRVLLGNIIKGAMGIVGSLTLLVFVYGGFLWLTSAGKAEQVKKGTDAMMWAAIGLFLIFGAYAILSLVLEAIGAKGAAAPPSAAPVSAPAAEKEKEGACVCAITDPNGGQTTDSVPASGPGECATETGSKADGSEYDCQWQEKK